MDGIRVLTELLAIDTTVPPGRNYLKAIDYLEPLFRQAGCLTQKIHIPAEHAEGREGRVSLVCHRRNSGKPRLVFYGHVDVVPAEGWDAFQPRVEKGKIYGRGAADMKGGLVALLLGLEAVKEKPIGYDVSVMVTVDEEFSQASQLRYLAQFLEPVRGAYVFSLDSSFGFVSIASLGLLQMTVRVKGKSVHSGMSHLGENAIEKAVPLMQALLELKNTVVSRKSRVGVHPATGLSKMEGRLNINQIESGLKVNIVPDRCLISIDRRLIPEETLADAEKELRDTLASVPGVEWEVEKVFRIPTVPPCRDSMVDILSGVIQEVTGSSGKYGEMGSGDLSAIVSSEWEGKSFGVGVIRPECNIHGKDEFAYQRDIADLARIISRLLQR